jgi:hypothetical protein
MASISLGNPASIAPISLETVRSLLEPQPAPCLSLYMPTHRTVPDNLVDQPTYRHLLDVLAMGLSASQPSREIDRLLEPLHAIEDNARFWQHTRDGLAVLAADGMARIFLLPMPVKPLALVTSRFHTMPLVRIAASVERFNVLTLTSRAAHVYEGQVTEGRAAGGPAGRVYPVPLHGIAGTEAAQGELDRGAVIDEEIFQPHRVQRGMGPGGRGFTSVIHGGAGSKQDDVDADTEIFFRHVDEVIHERVSKHSGLPLVLVALPRLAAVFRGLSKNRLLLDAYVDRDAHLLPEEALAPLVAPIFAAARDKRIGRELHLFEQARDHGLGSDDLSDIARAAVAGRVATLLIEKDRFETGRLDRQTGAIVTDGEAAGDLSRSGDRPALRQEDLFGAVAETVLLHGGGILALDRIAMPTESGVAAVFRY